MMYDAQLGNFCLMAVGDVLVSRRLAVFREPQYLALRILLQQSDIAFANLETVLHRFEHWPATAGGTFTACDPAIVDDLKWLGLGMLSVANNHGADYGIPGMLDTLGHLTRNGLPYAGAGRNLAEASEPTYVDTAMGRVALIACCATFAPGTEAMAQRPDHIGRPGINPLYFERRYKVDDATMALLADLKRKLGIDLGEPQRRNSVPGMTQTDTLLFLKHTFVRGEGFDTQTEVGADELQRHVRRIQEARQMADWVFVSCHSHESGSTPSAPPLFLSAFAHACIDAGADAFLGHGPHVIGPIEIYRNRPIFYSLGNFVFQNETVRRQPASNYSAFNLNHEAGITNFHDSRTQNGRTGFSCFEEYWRGFVAQVVFRQGKLDQVLLHPTELGFGLPRSQRGRPVLSAEPAATATLDSLQALSRPFGTRIERAACVGKVCL